VKTRGQRRRPIATRLPAGCHFEYETWIDPLKMGATRRINRAQAGKVNVLMLSVMGAGGAKIASAGACLGICRCHGVSYGDRPLVVNSVEVAAPYRHQGIATAMYCEIEAVMRRKLHPSTNQRTAGERFWAQPNRPFGIADTTHHP
jgi:hypothetical protein